MENLLKQPRLDLHSSFLSLDGLFDGDGKPWDRLRSTNDRPLEAGQPSADRNTLFRSSSFQRTIILVRGSEQTGGAKVLKPLA